MFKQSLFLLLASILTGLLSGVLGTVLTENYLESYARRLEDETARQLQLSQERSRPTPGSYEEAVDNARGSLLPSLVIFYNASDETTILPGTEVGVGVVVTSDGWVVTTEAALGSLARVGDATYAVEEVVRDSLTDAVFVDLEASGLPVIPFGDAAALETADQLFVGVGQSALLATTLVDADSWIGVAASAASERFVTALRYADEFPVSGAPVVDSSGDLVAIDTIPLDHLSLAITSAIRGGEVVRASFGVALIDLSHVRLPESLRRDFTRGAFVGSVTLGSPAAVAGLKYGDIITRIQDVSLSREKTVAEILAGFEPGKRITVVVDRDGAELSFEVELGQLP